MRLSLLLTALILTSATSIYIFYKRVAETKTNNPWYYISNDDFQLLKYIDENLPASSSILSSYYLGNLIPAFSDQRVYFGHLIQTPEVKQRMALMDKFYSCSFLETQALEFLQSAEIDYVIDSQTNSQLQANYSSLEECEYSFLVKIFSNNSHFVFAVK